MGNEQDDKRWERVWHWVRYLGGVELPRHTSPVAKEAILRAMNEVAAAEREKIATEIESFPPRTTALLGRHGVAMAVRQPEIIAKEPLPPAPILSLHPFDCAFRTMPMVPMLQDPRDIGKFYRTRDGRVVGPLAAQPQSAAWPFHVTGLGSVTADGRFNGQYDNAADLMAQAESPIIWTDKPQKVEAPAKKDWRDVPVTAGMLYDALAPDGTPHAGIGAFVGRLMLAATIKAAA